MPADAKPCKLGTLSTIKNVMCLLVCTIGIIFYRCENMGEQKRERNDNGLFGSQKEKGYLDDIKRCHWLFQTTNQMIKLFQTILVTKSFNYSLTYGSGEELC